MKSKGGTSYLVCHKKENDLLIVIYSVYIVCIPIHVIMIQTDHDV